MKWFKGITDAEAAKKRYYALSQRYYPKDGTAGREWMEIKTEYDRLLGALELLPELQRQQKPQPTPKPAPAPRANPRSKKGKQGAPSAPPPPHVIIVQQPAPSRMHQRRDERKRLNNTIAEALAGGVGNILQSIGNAIADYIREPNKPDHE